jgi:tetrahydromethanopterin S-methyltransferase subunit G
VADDRSLGEAHRRLDDHDRRLDRMVSREAYDADQRASDARHSRAERDIGDLYGRVRTFLWTVAAAITGTVTAGIILAILTRPHG